MLVRAKPKPLIGDRSLARSQSQILVEDTPVKPIKHFTGARPSVTINSTATEVKRDSGGVPSEKSSSLGLFERNSATDTPVKSGCAPKTSSQPSTDLECEYEDGEEWIIGSPSVRRSLVSAFTDEDIGGGSP